MFNFINILFQTHFYNSWPRERVAESFAKASLKSKVFNLTDMGKQCTYKITDN